MWTPFFLAAVFIFVFGGYILLCHIEAKKGERIFALRFRGGLDSVIESVFHKIERLVRYIIKYTITLSWYYSLHTFLKLALRFLAGVYYIIEAVLIKNRERVKAIRKEHRAEISHLSAIVQHKEDVKLSPAAERKLKDRALKGH